MPLFLNIVLLTFGVIIIGKSAAFLINGSSALAKRLKIPELLVGMTVVAFGTSLPEFFVNTIAIYQDKTELAISNVVGSNIANICLVLGVSALIMPVIAKHKSLWTEIKFNILSVCILLFLLIINGNTLNIISSFILLSGFVIFLLISYKNSHISSQVDQVKITNERILKISKDIILGLVGLVIGSHVLINNAVEIAEFFKVSEYLIGLTVLSIGTSLPELITSIWAATKKKYDLTFGNIIGSNIFNTFFILGIGSIIKVIPIQPEYYFDIVFSLLAGIALLIFMNVSKKYVLERYEGIILIIMYFIYLTVIILRG